MYGIHSLFEYRLMESRYGPIVETWPGASFHKPKPLDTITPEHWVLPSVEKKNEPESTSFDPLSVLSDIRRKQNEDRIRSLLHVPWLSKKEEETSSSWALPSFTSNQTEETSRLLASDLSTEKRGNVIPSFDYPSRKTCHACGGTGEALGITGVWRSTCWCCEGLGYLGPPPTNRWKPEQVEPTTSLSILRRTKGNESGSNLPTVPAFKTLSGGDEYHPGGTHCRDCGKFSNFNPCLDCSRKSFEESWKSLIDDDDDSDEYDADELGDDDFDED
jgi:hypothetical protein